MLMREVRELLAEVALELGRSVRESSSIPVGWLPSNKVVMFPVKVGPKKVDSVGTDTLWYVGRRSGRDGKVRGTTFVDRKTAQRTGEKEAKRLGEPFEIVSKPPKK